jgi:hypothetical protein
MSNTVRLLLSWWWFISAALFSVLFAITCPAQDAATGAIHGTVVDTGGSRIGAATVVLVNSATNFHYATTSDITGRFAFELLPPGDYSGRAESPGMSPQTTPRLHVDVGGTTELEFKLVVAGAKETVRFRESLHWSKPNPADCLP